MYRTIKVLLRERLVLVLIFLAAASASATQIVPGDVLWTATFTFPDVGFGSSEFGMLHGSTVSILHDYTPELFANAASAVNVSPASNIYVAETIGTATYDLSGTRTGYVRGAEHWMAWDRAGNVYMSSQGEVVRKKNASFQTLSTFTVTPYGVMGLDLGRDQCTLYFTTAHSTIGRYDVCRSLVLPDIVTPTAEAFGPIRVASDDSVFVAGDTAVFHFSSSGTLLQQYAPFGAVPYNSLTTIALGIQPDTLWIAGGSTFRLVDTRTAAVLKSVDGTAVGMGTIAVVGEPRAALAPDAVPLFSPWIAALFAAALIAVAALHARH